MQNTLNRRVSKYSNDAVPLKTNNSATNILNKQVIENGSEHRVSSSCPSNGTSHDVLLHKAI